MKKSLIVILLVAGCALGVSTSPSVNTTITPPKSWTCQEAREISELSFKVHIALEEVKSRLNSLMGQELYELLDKFSFRLHFHAKEVLKNCSES